MKQPVVPTLEQIERADLNIPQVGMEDPDGWEYADKMWFVDHSGFGQEGEPALTIRQFVNSLYDYAADNPTHGYGVIDVGQFQLNVAAFRPIEADEPLHVGD